MEQYELSPKKYFDMLSWALKNCVAKHICIRLVGSYGGTVKVNENLGEKNLSLKRSRSGLRIIIDSKDVFLFRLTSIRKDSRISGRCWSIAYFRLDNGGRMHYASTGYENPDDPLLPEIKQTIFRTANTDHLIEVVFSGKIPIRRTQVLVSNIPDWYYWEIDTKK